MKYLLIILVCYSCCGTKGNSPAAANTAMDSSVKPTTATSNTPADNQAPIALYFGSMASGPIGDDFLKTWLIKFRQDENVNITAEKFSACGKEGEYIIVINKTGFNASKETAFNTGLRKLIDDEVKRAKTVSASSGSVEIRENPKVEEYTYCRLGSKKWL